MTLLQCDQVAFGYAGDLLFRDVSFSLAAGERVGLVAPNGAGKTTLLKILARDIEPDEGRVIVPKDAKIGTLHQSHNLDPSQTVLDALMSGFSDLVSLRHSLESLQHGAATGDTAALDRLAEAQDRYDLAGGHALEQRVQALAGNLGFPKSALERLVGSLSGGERGRLALGVVLAAEPQVLLLDEPTNHLDLETTERLETILRSYPGAVVIISHDRAFLDATCPFTAELGSRVFRFYHAPYSQYLEQREADLVREEAAVTRQREVIARTEDFIRRNIAGQKTKQAQSRRKMLAKVERLDRPENIWEAARRMKFRFAECVRSGDIVLEAEHLSASRGGRTLFSDVNMLVRRGQRIGIVGPNGAGKTTLIAQLAERGRPDLGDSGKVRIGSNVVWGYFDQHLESLNPDRNAIDEIRSLRPDMVVDACREYLARFQFWGDDPFRQIANLSGGERTRLALAKMLLVPRNFLVLDEPTNHLDIPSTEILESALANFEGAVITVSHDRRFLERVCNQILHLDGGKVVLHQDGWAGFVRSRKAAREAPPPPKAAVTQRTAEEKADAKHRAKQRELERRIRQVERLEGEITKMEAELKELRAKLVAGDSPWEELAEMAAREQALQRELEQRTNRWAALSEQVEAPHES